MQRYRFVFVSSNAAWGGSEDLWSATAARLAEAGHKVTVYKAGIDATEPRIRRLQELKCSLHDLAWLPFLNERRQLLVRKIAFVFIIGQQLLRLRLLLAVARRPNLIVLSQGGNADGLLMAGIIRRTKMPYVLISHKATDLYWPPDTQRDRLQAVYREARACLFVSEHTRRLTEEQLNLRLPQSSIVRNPFLVPWEPRNDWPDERDGWRLACIGRMNLMEKGQDLLLRVLARDKWRNRPLTVTFYGDGPNRVGIEEMAAHLELKNVTFGGFVRDVTRIWSEHHGLILPSRCEGLPLVVVESMLSGRVPIVTDVGGNSEVIEDNTTGFLAAAPTEDSLDEVLERAWARRGEWRAIGQEAARSIRTLVPEDPAAALAAKLTAVAAGARG